jgi:hypothetical protein
MRSWRGVAVAGGAVLLALLVMSALAPDVGPSVGSPAAAPPASGRLASARAVPGPSKVRPVGPREASTADDHGEGDLSPDDGFDEGGITRDPEPPKPIDPNQTFTADLQGLAGAAVSRRQGLVDCIHAYQRESGDQGYDGRFTIKITVSPGEGHGAVSTDIVNGPDDAELYKCLDGVMGGASFESPDHPTSVMWPIPLVSPGDY